MKNDSVGIANCEIARPLRDSSARDGVGQGLIFNEGDIERALGRRLW
jgi:hypothetical protein